MNPTAWEDDPLAALDAVDPFPAYARVRRAGPAWYSVSMRAWVFTRHAGVCELLRNDHLLFESLEAGIQRLEQRLDEPLPSLSAMFHWTTGLEDVARQRNLRTILAGLLAQSRQPEFAQGLRAKVDELLGAFRASGRIDLAGFARDAALFSIATMLGLPCAELADLGGSRSATLLLSRDLIPLARLRAGERDTAKSIEYFLEKIRDRRARPRDDGLSRGLAAASGWEDTHFAGLCAFVLGAATDSSVSAFVDAAHRLMGDAALRESLRREPAMIAAAAREILRLATPLHYTARLATADVMVGGQPLRKGDIAIAVLAAANRDPAAFPDPDAIVLNRPAGADSLAFGLGMMRCAGAQVATLLMQTVIEGLLKLPEARACPGHSAFWLGAIRTPRDAFAELC